MNQNKNHKVVTLVLICFSVYLTASAMSLIFNVHWQPLDRVNLLSDLFVYKTEPSAKNTKASTQKIITEQSPEQDFQLYKKPEFITNFYKGDSICALPRLAAKIARLQKTKKGKIRIAYFGDSMIEGDLLTQTLRRLLQQELGGYGVGFVPITSNVNGFRQTVTCAASGWKDTNFMTSGAKNLYISGHIFTGNGTAQYRDNTIKNNDVSIRKSILFGKADNGSLTFNNQTISINGKEWVNSQMLSDDTSHTIKIHSNTASMPLYGVSFESENGVFLDNFSFRGITGVELAKINDEVFEAINQNTPYDLIVLQYGVNLLFRPNDKNYDYYAQRMVPVLARLKKDFPNTDFLLISSADRAFRYNGEMKTAVGMPNLIQTQAQLAFENGLAFYNQFESMGGENAIVKWAQQNPPLANKDYIHPNAKGGDVLAEKIFRAMMNDYKKYNPKTKNKK
ncbi:SGNH/GDSL hydrolase family protein [Riemerella columbipharyngis]|uniref:Lysophospholipase L1 n=1 Tax=Riemerella columbipharyngis TaxID=1071918 RepID=A0A1G6YNL7_9FLAO|nr:hypothetical protein [Riemerella columbipharyngis]SDD91911.1 Lysophospholipase L1 [Riemerella columbipharyngis]